MIWNRIKLVATMAIENKMAEAIKITKHILAEHWCKNYQENGINLAETYHNTK